MGPSEAGVGPRLVWALRGQFRALRDQYRASKGQFETIRDRIGHSEAYLMWVFTGQHGALRG